MHETAYNLNHDDEIDISVHGKCSDCDFDGIEQWKDLKLKPTAALQLIWHIKLAGGDPHLVDGGDDSESEDSSDGGDQSEEDA